MSDTRRLIFKTDTRICGPCVLAVMSFLPMWVTLNACASWRLKSAYPNDIEEQ